MGEKDRRSEEIKKPLVWADFDFPITLIQLSPVKQEQKSRYLEGVNQSKGWKDYVRKFLHISD